uniref:Uncharacterized protein n=1 Tax=Nelumbo nucifera TaxID=4432 RepID=A0A822XXU5_NELNU|nr:TPA_asm: hypothetical protein HUJ06_025289 [Nelumbo nucifera]
MESIVENMKMKKKKKKIPVIESERDE